MELFEFIQTLTAAHGPSGDEGEIRALAEEMLRLVYPVAPHLFRTAGPGCLAGPCPEGRMCCGHPDEVRERYRALRREAEA